MTQQVSQCHPTPTEHQRGKYNTDFGALDLCLREHSVFYTQKTERSASPLHKEGDKTTGHVQTSARVHTASKYVLLIPTVY